MAERKRSSDENLLSEDQIAKLEKDMATKSAEDHNKDYMKLSQGGLRPVYVIVWRLQGMACWALRACPAPFRRGERALVDGAARSVQMGDHEEPCFMIKYADSINKQYPQTVFLPVECYVWSYVAADRVGLMYCERKDKAKF
jgi:hypothetical protein